jgi:hypothetical protein
MIAAVLTPGAQPCPLTDAGGAAIDTFAYGPYGETGAQGQHKHVFPVQRNPAQITS